MYLLDGECESEEMALDVGGGVAAAPGPGVHTLIEEPEPEYQVAQEVNISNVSIL